MDSAPIERLPRSRIWSPAPRVAVTSLFLLGLLVGLALALYYAWIVDPVVFVEAGPARLNEGFKAEYIYLVSQSYAGDGNWARAEARLHALGDPNIGETVASQLEGYLRRGAPASTIRNLAIVAEKLGAHSPAIAAFAPTPPLLTPAAVTNAVAPQATLLPTPTLTPEPTDTPQPTATLLPTAAPTSTPQPVYRLLDQQRVCEVAAPAPRIEIITVDAFLEPLPGAAVIVTWDGGSDRFHTGFKPELGLGYGDFTMVPDVSYSITLAEGSPTVSGLRIEPCPSNRGGLPGGWRLSFQNLTLPDDE
jgi:hypothetical protein